MSEKLTQKRLKEVLHYDTESGVFTWKIRRGGTATAGVIAGKEDVTTIKISVDSKTYLAHRLVWLYVYGYFPENDIDHKDRNPFNNILTNLREVSHTCNMRNRNISKNNTSGVTGLSYIKKTNLWQVIITVNYKNIYIGRFSNKIDASMARWNAEKKYNFPNCNTTSSAFMYLESFKNQNNSKQI